MNSRDRVLQSISLREPDRVPVDLGASTVTGISAIALNRLKDRMGITSPTLVFDVVQQLARVDDAILDHFGVDAMDINRVLLESMVWHETRLADGSPAFFPDRYRPELQEDGTMLMYDPRGRPMSKKAPKGTVFDQILFPWEEGYPEDFNSITEAFESINWIAHSHSRYLDNNAENQKQILERLRSESKRALLMSGGAKLLELGFFLRRMDQLLMDLLADHENLGKLLDKLMEIHLAGLEKKLSTVGDLVDVIRFGDDLGMTSGPFMDLETFRTFFKPRYKELCDFVKQKSGLKIFFHSCGSIRSFIPDLIEVGFDILNPVQTNCHGMDALELKNEFGREICFWGGGVDTASVLPGASPEDVRRDVLRRCEILSRGGGFVFAPIHNILPDVPPENIIAAYDAVREFNG